MRREVKCILDYVEDGIKYWSAGYKYKATKHHDGTWSIITNYGNVGKVGQYYLLDNFNDYFVEVKKQNKLN